MTRSNKVLGIASISKEGISGTIKDVRIILQYARGYFRSSNESEITNEMERLNSDNMTALLKILDETKNNQLLMKV